MTRSPAHPSVYRSQRYGVLGPFYVSVRRCYGALFSSGWSKGAEEEEEDWAASRAGAMQNTRAIQIRKFSVEARTFEEDKKAT